MISDLSTLLAMKERSPIAHKLAFYASHVLGAQPASWDLLLGAIRQKANERAQNEDSDKREIQRASKAPKIEEL